jgi:hypothetical protein
MDHYYYFLNVLKNVLYNAQNDQQTAPMASERPKTPSWDFFGTSFGQKTKKLGFLEVSPSSLLSLHLQNTPLFIQPSTHAI